MSAARAAAVLAALGLSGPGAAQPFDWDTLGAEFCARSVSGDLAALRPLITASLAQGIDSARARAPGPLPSTLFQSYANAVPLCAARTRNAAIVEIRRSGPGGAAPAWTEYLVVVPEADGATRIDDVLYATRRSDTLRARLREIAE